MLHQLVSDMLKPSLLVIANNLKTCQLSQQYKFYESYIQSYYILALKTIIISRDRSVGPVSRYREQFTEIL